MEACIFCNIANGAVPVEFIYENEYFVAFHDIEPKAPVHILIVSKQHIKDMNEFAKVDQTCNLSATLIQTIQAVAKKVGIDQSGYRIINNCGVDGGQTVLHFHVHLLGGKILGELVG